MQRGRGAGETTVGAGRVRRTEETDGGSPQETGLWVNMTLCSMFSIVVIVIQPLLISFYDTMPLSSSVL